MSNAPEYASEDSRLLQHAIQSTEDLVEGLERLKNVVDDIADGARSISEDEYERALTPMSVTGITRRMNSTFDAVDDCADALENAQR